MAHKFDRRHIALFSRLVHIHLKHGLGALVTQIVTPFAPPWPTCRLPPEPSPLLTNHNPFDCALVPVLCVDTCLLYTSDAADEEDSVDLGGRRIIKKKKNRKSDGSMRKQRET
eukprot:TRINITY_DN2328_c0_g1_i1.p2 TRINITY_DN2328_c0_g1~~TRINITY_DN2328_c0_g1_i1.p2  ORF type:complete len:113 (-),score=7.94 TRINITY_DN2328_c0_g1_i1:27-365(-)